jgi:hypothetical protein
MAQTISEVDPRLRTRMLDVGRCTIFAILAPSYRGTIQRRSERRSKDRGPRAR